MVADAEEQTEAGDQLVLIDVEHPMHKPFKALKKKMDEVDEDQSSLREEQDTNTDAMIALFIKHDIKPDSNGVRRIEIDGGIIEVAPGKSKLKFRKKPKPKEETLTEEATSIADELEGDEPKQLQPRKKK